MDVYLLVYDLSRGLARQMSMGLLGFQLDAIYHTSIELQGREYVYDGGIIAIAPGSSHLGQPMEKLHLGQTHLPIDIVEEFLDSIRSIFTLEAYDLFRHNCNNFSDSFVNFLLGKGIPSHITSMPQAVMDSPMGRMLLPQLTQGINGTRQNGSILGLQESSQTPAHGQTQNAVNGAPRRSGVQNVTALSEFTSLLNQAKQSSAVVFFTSATCPPCKILYPVYDELADEFGDGTTFIKVDISTSQGNTIAQQYKVSATPTLITFLKGDQENRWSGADPAALRGNVRLLSQMAVQRHPHERLRLPSFADVANSKPVLFTKVPPMAKLMTKMGDELAKNAEILALRNFLEVRDKDGAADATVPDLTHLSNFILQSLSTVPVEVLFTVVDLVRCALSDPRISGFFAEEAEHKTTLAVLHLINNLDDCPYALRLVTLQMACNFFSTPLFPTEILRNESIRTPIIQLISSSFLDDSHNNTRVAASSLMFNLALMHRRSKASNTTEGLPDDNQVELAASVVEAISQEEKSGEALQGMLSALGHLVYGTDLDGELADLLRALDAEGTIRGKQKAFPSEKLVSEVGNELIGKGLRRP